MGIKVKYCYTSGEQWEPQGDYEQEVGVFDISDYVDLSDRRTSYLIDYFIFGESTLSQTQLNGLYSNGLWVSTANSAWVLANEDFSINNFSMFFNCTWDDIPIGEGSFYTSYTLGYKCLYDEEPKTQECLVSTVYARQHIKVVPITASDPTIEGSKYYGFIVLGYEREKEVTETEEIPIVLINGFLANNALFEIEEIDEETGKGDDTNPEDLPNWDGAYNIPSVSIDNGNTGNVKTYVGTLYKLNNSQLTDFREFINGDSWSGKWNNFWGNPEECIVKCFKMPINPSPDDMKEITLGSIDTDINAPCFSDVFRYGINCGDIDLKKYKVSWQRTSPYSRVRLYLPYCGVLNLDANDCLGYVLNVVYEIELASGKCLAVVRSSRHNSTHLSGGIIATMNGDISIDVPFGRKDTSGVTSAIVGALAGGIALATAGAGVGAVVGAGASGLLATAGKEHYSMIGSSDGVYGLYNVQKPYVEIEYPNQAIPESYDELVGRPSGVLIKLSRLKGFNKIGSIDLKCDNITKEELNELYTILRNGIHV